MKKRLIFSTIIALILVWLPSAIAEAQTSQGKEAITMDFNNEPLPAIFKRLEKVSVYLDGVAIMENGEFVHPDLKPIADKLVG